MSRLSSALLVTIGFLLAVGTTLANANGKAKKKIITASAIANGTQVNVQTGTAATKGPSKVECLNASNGNNGQGTCYILGPGYHGDVQPGHEIGTSGAGTVTLTCDGNPYPLRCTAEITEEKE